MNFILLVPLASYPAVEIWLDTSLAGIRRSARNIVLGEKDHLHATANNRITVYRACQIVDELDNEFGQPIGGRSLARNGDIALHLVTLLQKPQFVQTFSRKGRFKDLMERLPIHIITIRAAFLMAATFGLQGLSNLNKGVGVKGSLAAV